MFDQTITTTILYYEYERTMIELLFEKDVAESNHRFRRILKLMPKRKINLI
jgi:hypothetical protein